MNRRAFTLMELMVVVLIIGVLVAIVLGVATGVTSSGRRALTTDTMRVLELALEDYSSVKGARPAPHIIDPRIDPQNFGGEVPVFPVADARDFGLSLSNDRVMINSAGFLVEQLRDVSSAYDAVVESLSADALRQYSPTPLGNAQSTADLRHPLLPTPFDAWGNPIRYVHPTFDGLLFSQDVDLTDPAEPISIEDDLRISPPGPYDTVWVMRRIRRNAESTGTTGGDEALPDSDGGICRGDHPYFYSAGPDGDPSTTDDNVYGASTPTFQSTDN